MLGVKENLKETMKKNGNPDRFVKQFEFVNQIVPDNYYMGDYPIRPGTEGYDQFGVLWRYPEGQMGAFPVHDAEHIVLKDITQWREIVKKPVPPEDPGFWGFLNNWVERTDFDNQYLSVFQPQGIFERLHALMGMEDAMASFYEEPEEMHALIDFLTEIEIEFAQEIINRFPVEAVFHHDDWGSLKSSFLSPQMFHEFITPAYKQIYGFYHEKGMLVIHHNDAYSANLVPDMIEMGIDIWQGPTPTNDIPKLIEEYGGDITFMGEIETKLLDVPDWTPEMVREEVERACRKCGKHSFIPCLTSGGAMSTFPGVYDAVNEEIDRMSKIMF